MAFGVSEESGECFDLHAEWEGLLGQEGYLCGSHHILWALPLTITIIGAQVPASRTCI